jgi:hypothetical protein
VSDVSSRIGTLRDERDEARCIALLALGALWATVGQDHHLMPQVKAWAERLGVDWSYGPVGPDPEPEP